MEALRELMEFWPLVLVVFGIGGWCGVQQYQIRLLRSEHDSLKKDIWDEIGEMRRTGTETLGLVRELKGSIETFMQLKR